MNGNHNTGLARALELSLELLAVAERGDVGAVANLDAERLRLLDSQRPKSRNMDADERLVLNQINELNDKALGLLEHRRRSIERDMDTAAAGRRALVAYSATRTRLQR
ncbi:MAG TPA: hypothetical protein VNR70_00990 [Steroidobacteraceae bacterium]|jgi:hypothetical protein|nr:hypothetical protein [Steroidobacteraceae bacterium]